MTLLAFQSARFEGVLGMIMGGTLSTRIILFLLAVFSLSSWTIIWWKMRLFSSTKREGRTLSRAVAASSTLEEAYKRVNAAKDSPFARVFKKGAVFFGELKRAPGSERIQGLTTSQLEALTMLLEREETVEKDDLARGVIWLAVIGTVSPLMGLLGTVLGVMNSFLGISAAGSTNIGAVAPGIAEALIATAIALAVAIPAVMGYNYLVSRLDELTSVLEGFSSEFIGALAREGRI